MLFNEPKLLKSQLDHLFRRAFGRRFSALQRAEIAEIAQTPHPFAVYARWSFSALQRAEIAEIPKAAKVLAALAGFSALQRAEIAEIDLRVPLA